MNKFKILFIGPLKEGSTCRARLNALIQLQNEIMIIDTSNWLSSKIKLINSIVQRIYFSFFIIKINFNTIKIALSNNIKIIWIEKGEYIYPITLKYLNYKKIYLINYNTDNIFLKKGNFWLHKMGIKYYHLYLSTNRLNVIDLVKKFNLKTFRVSMGYDKSYQDIVTKYNYKKYDIVFIGHWEPHTEKYITTLISNGFDIKVWGHNWKNASNYNLRKIKPLEQSKYLEVIATSKIALCSLSKWNKNESTGRSFEIPAIGTLLLSEYTLEQDIIYNDGIGAVLFHDTDDLVKKAKFYLNNDFEREKIARIGNLITKKTGLSWEENLKREWKIICNIYNTNILIDDNFLWNGYREGKPGKNN